MNTVILMFFILGGFISADGYIRSGNRVIWKEANDFCRNHNGSLIQFNNQTLVDKYEEYKKLDSVHREWHWTGLILNDTCKNSLWQYSGWSNWGPREPNHCPRAKCIAIDKNTRMRTRRCCRLHYALCVKEQSDNDYSTRLANEDLEPCNTTIKTGSPPELDNLDTDICYKCCAMSNQTKHLTTDELTAAVQQLKAQLAVNKTNLSSSRRKLVSVYDSRPSSVAVGSVAVAILAVGIGLIVIPDIASLIRFLYNRPQRLHGNSRRISA